MRWIASSCIYGCLAAALTTGCVESSGETETDTSNTSDSDGETGDLLCDMAAQPCVDESACTPLASDYQPRANGSADDMWPTCIADSGSYTLVASEPGSIARVQAFESIADLLWRNGTPSAADFTEARTVYVTPEGLESRLVRREDLHYPAIPMEDWDDQVDADKQCTVPANVTKYPERCAGPAVIGPLITENFVAGQDGTGEPDVAAARIEAALLWFYYLSAYKEANTCLTKSKDCDSAWAYYTGGFQIDGGIGMAGYVRQLSENAHTRIFDGVLAMRCYAEYSEASDASEWFDLGTEQLDQALHRGYTVIVRERLLQHLLNLREGSGTELSWAFLEVAGPVLDREATARNPGDAAKLRDYWTGNGGDETSTVAAIETLDQLFPCP